MPDVSIVIPAFNEAQRIIPTLNSIRNFKGEVILVNDGSTDGTLKVAQKYPFLKIISHSENQGKGAAVKTGIMASSGEGILVMDADNSTPVSELAKLKKHLPDYDIVIGSRALDRSLVKVRQPWFKELMGRLGNWPIRLFLVPGIKDTQCGFKLFSAKTKSLWSEVQRNDYSYDFEFLHLAQKNNFKIKEVPVAWANHPGSKVKLKDYFQTLINIIKIKFNFKF